MNNVYKILWFDDNAPSQKAFERRLRSQLRKLGFGLTVEYHQSTNMNLIAELCKRLRVYNEFDLIMFDHKLEGVMKGARFAAEFRRNKIYTDMVYYSSSDGDTLWSALRQAKVDGVYILNRDGMDNDLIRIVKEQVARIFDVSNMRGFILQFMSQVEGRLRSLLIKGENGFEGVSEKVVNMIRVAETSIAKKRLTEMEKLTIVHCTDQVVSGGISFDRVRSVLAKTNPEHVDVLGEGSLLVGLQRTRNVFAHRRHHIDPHTHRLYLEGDKTHPDGYSKDDFTELRVQLMKLADELFPITGTL